MAHATQGCPSLALRGSRPQSHARSKRQLRKKGCGGAGAFWGVACRLALNPIRPWHPSPIRQQHPSPIRAQDKSEAPAAPGGDGTVQPHLAGGDTEYNRAAARSERSIACCGNRGIEGVQLGSRIRQPRPPRRHHLSYTGPSDTVNPPQSTKRHRLSAVDHLPPASSRSWVGIERGTALATTLPLTLDASHDAGPQSPLHRPVRHAVQGRLRTLRTNTRPCSSARDTIGAPSGPGATSKHAKLDAYGLQKRARQSPSAASKTDTAGQPRALVPAVTITMRRSPSAQRQLRSRSLACRAIGSSTTTWPPPSMLRMTQPIGTTE